MTEPRLLINVFHPDLTASPANRLTVEELRQLPGAAMRDIQQAYPDWRIHVAKEQELLLAHDLIVFRYPFYWYNCPALMKLWMDEGITGFRNATDDDIAAHGRALRDYLAGHRA